ncbi:MAG: hypothetical protein HY509_00885, partial [Acidobacteria bacterium]|nr:hypothetical protein [Acidobacteriota bacterium]
GEPLDGLEPLTLEIAREVYRMRPAAVSLEGTARQLGAQPDRARRSLACLERSGFALPAGWTMNFSGSAWIRLRPTA